MEQMIRIEKVTKRSERGYIVKEMNLVVREGETIGFIGNKEKISTFMKMLSGEIIPCEGEIYYQRERLSHYGQTPDYVGIYIDRIGFLEEFSGFKNLKYIAGMNGMAQEKEIIASMKFVGLNPKNSWSVSKYTRRMLQKLSICQAIMEGQYVLLLDAGLFAYDNEDNHVEIVRILKKLKKYGFTMMITAENSCYIEEICDNIHRID